MRETSTRGPLCRLKCFAEKRAEGWDAGGDDHDILFDSGILVSRFPIKMDGKYLQSPIDQWNNDPHYGMLVKIIDCEKEN